MQFFNLGFLSSDGTSKYHSTVSSPFIQSILHQILSYESALASAYDFWWSQLVSPAALRLQWYSRSSCRISLNEQHTPYVARWQHSNQNLPSTLLLVYCTTTRVNLWNESMKKKYKKTQKGLLTRLPRTRRRSRRVSETVTSCFQNLK